MELKLELLECQETAIKSVVNIFDGNDKNTFDNACTDGIRSNICSLSNEQLTKNIKLIVLERALDTTKKWNLKHAMGDKFNPF